MEDLVQFAVIVGFLLVWLLGTGKKKSKRPTQPQQRPRPQARPRREPAASRPASSRATAPAPPARKQPETLADLLRDVLQGELPDATRVPEPEPELEPEAQSLEVTVEVPPAEAVSLETLEPAGGKSHVAFHERYIDVPAAEPAPAARHRYRLTPRTAREAVIWTAIFSHPKGME